MNFEFLKDLRGLDGLYNNCSNAEKLVRTMPSQSIFTSRKSAELLAKFIYMAACNQHMEQMTFADILSDWTFRDFIQNRDVLNAFHFIRKQGNRAVHDDNEEDTIEEAIDVLQDLHFVSGESAKLLGLIKKYPPFEKNIQKYPNAVYYDDDKINEEAMKMFLAYAEEYDALLEREKYEGLSLWSFFDYSLHGNADFHEYVECMEPLRSSFLEELQYYLLELLQLEEEDRSLDCEIRAAHFVIELLIEGDELFTSEDKAQLVSAIKQKLPSAKSFILNMLGTGKLRRFYNFEDQEDGDDPITSYNLVKKDRAWDGAGLLDKMEFMKRRASFIYKFFAYYPDCDETKIYKIENGKDIDIWNYASTNIVNAEFKPVLWGHNIDLWVDFDYDEHPGTLEQLYDIVRAYIPEAELDFCEAEVWTEEEEKHCLLRSIEWDVTSLRTVQDFLDEINKVILPFKEELDIYTAGMWVSSKDFIAARIEWTDEGFRVVGVEY